MCTHRLNKLRANPPRRVQRRTCVLKHHRDFLTAQSAPFSLGEYGKVLCVKGNRTRVNLSGEPADLRDCLEQGGFSAAALADDAKHLACAETEVDVLNDGFAAVSCHQMVDSQQFFHRHVLRCDIDRTITSYPDPLSHDSNHLGWRGSR